ncbi:LuxR C-terminal-related transcriptional regulator [Paenibacillus solani]|uniref:LuxR family transcriptional regulator n=1 Tax=Paenibacillus solani TaxID=1705565 RepID=A0A0M1P1C9_9BACL|nr:LuxR C-terminal-related transcriptional regulator [Paenibacillus solani]KOR87884.1 LuxR family transcriptional regulator [Paenibacillus solani]
MGEGTVILRTKLQPPALRDAWISRSVWDERENQGSGYRIITVVAPAGSGKTIALVQHMLHEGTQGPASWLTLDEQDNDLRRFWRYMIHSLLPYLPPGIENRLLPFLVPYSDQMIYSFLDSFIMEMHGISMSINVVLDDYHSITHQEIHESLNYWIEHLPDSIRLFIASRAELPLKGMGRWLLSGRLLRIGAQELAFNEEDANSLCQHTLGRSLSPEKLNTLVQRTEGWAAGLQLALIALRQNEAAGMPDYDAFSQSNRHMSDYLSHEVMRGLDKPLRQFLLETSVMRRFHADICAAVTEMPECDDMLEVLKAKGLFLIPLDHQELWHRYHHVFGDFLSSLLKQQDPERWIELNRRASQVYAREGWHEEAIDYALLAEDYEMAAALVDQHMMELIKKGEFDLLQLWLNRFPEGIRLPDRLLLVKIFVYSLRGKHDLARNLLEQLEAGLYGRPIVERQLEWLSGLFFVKANLAFNSRQFDEWFQFAQTIEHRLPEDPIFFNFNYNNREPFVRNTPFGLQGVLTDTTAQVGTRIVSILESHGWEDSLMCQYVMQAMAEGFYEKNEVNACVFWLDRLLEGRRYRDVPGLFIPIRLTMARLKRKERNRHSARAIVQDALNAMQAREDILWCSALRAFLVELDLRDGELSKAEVGFQELNLSSMQRISLEYSLEIMTWARLLIHQQRNEQAQAMLAALRIQAEEAGSINITASVIVLQAQAEYTRGNVKAAALFLQEALSLVMPYRYKRTFMDEGNWLYQLLQELNTIGDSVKTAPLKEYMTELMDEIRQEKLVGLDLLDPFGTYGLTPQETQVLILLHRGDTNQSIADELGLTVGTVKVYLNRIYSKLGVSSRVQAVLKTFPGSEIERSR